MFDLILCNETNDFLKEIRKALKNKGYNKTISKCNRRIGSLQLNYVNEYYTKAHESIMFEIEKDLTNNTITTRLHYIENGVKRFKEIRLADVMDLA